MRGIDRGGGASIIQSGWTDDYAGRVRRRRRDPRGPTPTPREATIATTEPQIRHTPLFELHQRLEGKLVDFAGYRLPVQYPDGIIAEHLHTRQAAGLFDVSHMGQVRVTGDEIARRLEAIVPAGLEQFGVGRTVYSFFTNDRGGILDDLLITREDDGFFLVVNAACKDDDIEHLRTHLGADAVEPLTDRALLALQGPRAAEALRPLAPGIDDMVFLDARWIELDGHRCRISRTGYTGEDGFELSIPNEAAEAIATRLLEHDAVKPVGLGARDSLRLEAGLCLYGHDLDTTTTPIEADLSWAIPKRRRADRRFPGGERIADQCRNGTERRRVGIRPQGRAPVREGAELIDADEQVVGHVTSGGFGPSVGAPVAMGYVQRPYDQSGGVLQAMVRGKPRPVEVVDLPFIAHRYHRGS